MSKIRRLWKLFGDCSESPGNKNVREKLARLKEYHDMTHYVPTARTLTDEEIRNFNPFDYPVKK